MLNCLSTRNKLSSQDKTQCSTRFFKKLSTDENERNYINYLDKFALPRGNASCKNILTVAQLARNEEKKNSKGKKMLLSHATKSFKTLMSVSISDKENKCLRKEHSTKNLKLTASVELPQLLTKSISQTTVNRKMDEGKLRLLEKAGFRRKIEKCAGEKDEKGIERIPGERVQDKTVERLLLERTNEKPKKKDPQLKISQFRLGKKLGSGRFGNVYIAQDKDSRTLFALKVMNKSKIKEADMESQIFWQIKLQVYMHHPNILKLYGFFDDAKNIYLVLEYCSKCLFRQFRTRTKFSEEETAYYAKQAISALKYMHNQSIIHRDIKPENIMLEHGVLKLSDFGWSTYAPLYKRQTFCGTVDYVPPEIVEGNTYDERVDIWALGVLIFQLSSGFAPFETKDENITYDKIVHSECKYPSHFSKQLKDTIARILDKNPSRRPNLQQIESDSWLQKYKSTGRYISKDVWNAWDAL